MTAKQLLALTQHPEQLNRDTLFELRNVLNKYPYFHTARILYLRNLFLLNDPDFHTELRRTAVSINDRAFLFKRTEGLKYKNTLHSHEQENSEQNAKRKESKDAKDTISQKNSDRTLSLIDNFLGKLPDEAGDLPEILESENSLAPVAEQPLDTGCFTETLAKVYIKQQRYDRALQIMERLYADNPKKRAYFAAQIDIIKELITQKTNK